MQGLQTCVVMRMPFTLYLDVQERLIYELSTILVETYLLDETE